MIGQGKIQIRFFPGLWIVAIILLFFAVRAAWLWSHYPHRMERLAQELSSISIIQKAPVANHAGTLVGVIHTTDLGVGVFLNDIENNTEKKLCEVADVDYMASRDWLFGWSPDDATLAYSWDYSMNFVGTGSRTTDGKIDGISNRIQSFVRLTPTNGAFLDESQQLVSVQFAVGKWKETAVWQLSGTNGPAQSLQVVDTNQVAWHTRNLLWLGNISTGEINPIYSSAPQTIGGISYSRATGEFLVVENTNRSAISSLVALGGPREHLQRIAELTRKSSITAARWINQGRGYAYVAPTRQGEANVLTVKHEGSLREVTWFTNGQVWSIFCDGESSRVYALADESAEPAGVWQCNADNGDARCVVSAWPHQGMTFPFQTVARRWAHYKQGGRTHAAKFDLVAPANFSRHRKYPLMIGTAAYEWTPIPHAVYAQCLANCGVYVALVDYRWNQRNPETVYAQTNNVLAVYDELMKNPNIDQNRVFLFGFSAGTMVVSELVKHYPGRWRGILLLNPSQLPEARAGMTRRVLTTAGSSENEEERFRRYQEALFKAGIPMDWHIHANAQHVVRDQAAMYERTLWMTDMIFDE